MGILLGFAPFGVFALLSRFVPASISLWSAAAVSAVLILRQKMRGGSMKILEVGTFVLFAALGTYALLRGNNWDVPMVRSVVDGGLLLIILLSIMVSRPFTLQYAREQVPASVQDSPRFTRTNYIISAVWAVAMAVIVLADLTMHFVHSRCSEYTGAASEPVDSVGGRRHSCRSRRRILVHQLVSNTTQPRESDFMTARRAIFSVHIVFITCMFAVLPSFAQNTAQKIFIGDTKVTMLHSYSGTDKLPKPALVTVFDFAVPPEVVTVDKSVPAHVLDHDPIARMKRTAGQKSDPAAVAAKVQAAFSKRLIKELKSMPIPVSSAASNGNSASLPNVVTVQGEFTAVKQGNEAVRMLIGFGRGASDVKAHVVVSLTTPTTPVVLAEFDLSSESGKKPGAAATMGAGAAAGASVAASGATDSKASVEGDSARMANVVATEIENIMVAQQWIAPAKNAKRVQTAQGQQAAKPVSLP